MDSDIGGAVGEEGSDQADKVDRKGEGLELEEETGMPNTVVGFFEVEGNKDGSATGIDLGGEEVGKAKELVVGREGRSEATLGGGKELVFV